ncbi:MAG: glycoside hydrolase family 16 protein, partial [Bacteroidota bacterium]
MRQKSKKLLAVIFVFTSVVFVSCVENQTTKKSDEKVLFQTVSAQTPKHILEDFTIFWSDEFNGEYIDTNKWDHRDTGNKRVHGIVSEENTYLDKEGHLIIEVTKRDSIYQIGQICTQNTFLTQFGYFECRSKMNK